MERLTVSARIFWKCIRRQVFPIIRTIITERSGSVFVRAIFCPDCRLRLCHLNCDVALKRRFHAYVVSVYPHRPSKPLNIFAVQINISNSNGEEQAKWNATNSTTDWLTPSSFYWRRSQLNFQVIISCSIHMWPSIKILKVIYLFVTYFSIFSSCKLYFEC